MVLQAAPTPRDVLYRDGSAALYRFRSAARGAGLPLLLVPSLINRWYVLDLHEGSSVVEALVGAGIDTYCLDWGRAEDEDRYLEWDDVLARLGRACRAVLRRSDSARLGLLGYCMGGTLAAIQAALEPERCAALVNLAGPIDFSEAGMLGKMVDRRWFDADAIAAAGNVRPLQMQSGFTALRPTMQLSKIVRWLDRAHDSAALDRTAALEAWAGDNIPFPGATYARYIGALYQDNELLQGRHHVGGRRVDLGAIDCPVLTVVASHDTICPPASARALAAQSSSSDVEEVCVPGGHVGAVVGAAAAHTLYPKLTSWLSSKLQLTRRGAA
jgi:polyhydroxyalkanoate synthase